MIASTSMSKAMQTNSRQIRAKNDVAALQSDLETLKGLTSASQKRQDSVARLTQARDELRSYLRFMMFLLSPEKQRQLSAILSRIEALIESGSRHQNIMPIEVDSEKAVRIQLHSAISDEDFLQQVEKTLAQMRKALTDPKVSKI